LIVILFIALQFTALHWILSPESDHQASLLIPLIEDFSITEGYICSPSPMLFFQCVLVVSPQQVIAVAELTEGQHQNALWAAVRKQFLIARRHKLNQFVCFSHVIDEEKLR
jgi:hypothetical protein